MFFTIYLFTSNAHVTGGGGWGTPGIPETVWGLFGDFEINTSLWLCSGGNKDTWSPPYLWGKCGDFVFNVFVRLSGDRE